MRVIINADDFGCNQMITESIIELLLSGYISSTTIMANGKFLEEAITFAKSHSEYSYGAHLCLSEYQSITKNPIFFKYGITNENGEFIKYQIFRIKHFPLELKMALKKELNAQIDILISSGVPISHIDSHHHVHTIYELRNIFIDVANRYGIKKIRLATEFDTFRAKTHIIQYVKRRLLCSFYKREMYTTDVFMPFAQFYQKKSKLDMRKVETIELMCHPGHKSNVIFENEIINLLSNPLTHSQDLELINYNNL